MKIYHFLRYLRRYVKALERSQFSEAKKGLILFVAYLIPYGVFLFCIQLGFSRLWDVCQPVFHRLKELYSAHPLTLAKLPMYLIYLAAFMGVIIAKVVACLASLFSSRCSLLFWEDGSYKTL